MGWDPSGLPQACQSPGHGGIPTRMPLGMHFEVLGSGMAPNICFLLHPNKKQYISGALPDPSTPKCIPKGILVATPPMGQGSDCHSSLVIRLPAF